MKWGAFCSRWFLVAENVCNYKSLPEHVIWSTSNYNQLQITFSFSFQSHLSQRDRREKNVWQMEKTEVFKRSSFQVRVPSFFETTNLPSLCRVLVRLKLKLMMMMMVMMITVIIDLVVTVAAAVVTVLLLLLVHTIFRWKAKMLAPCRLSCSCAYLWRPRLRTPSWGKVERQVNLRESEAFCRGYLCDYQRGFLDQTNPMASLSWRRWPGKTCPRRG